MRYIDTAGGAEDVGVSSATGATGGDVDGQTADQADGPPWIDLCGIRVTRLTDGEFLHLVHNHLVVDGATHIAVGSVNLDHIHYFGQRRRRAARVSGVATDPRWLMLADGAPISRRATALTGQLWPRLAGADLLPQVLDVAVDCGARVGFLGGTTQSVAALQAQLRAERPDLIVSGYWTPPRSVLVDAKRSRELATRIRTSGVDLLVVGLGKPLQEQWIDDFGGETGASVLTAFGGAADFLGGTTRRAPQWMRSAGFEWLFRLTSDPRRLSRRYLVQGPPALYQLLGDRARSGAS